MEDAFEELSRWYLRFNGFFYVENFIIHEPAPGSRTIPQGAEIDTLAVRFPHSREIIAGDRKRIVRDQLLESPLPDLINFVIAEVKGGDRIQLNSIWESDGSYKNQTRIEYLLRWIGCFPDEETIARLSAQFQREHKAEYERYSFRLILFAKRKNPQNLPPGIEVITFTEIMEFIVRSRANSWSNLGIATRSQHTQWSELIKNLWTIAGPENNQPYPDKIRRMSEFLDSTNELRRVDSQVRSLMSKLLAAPLFEFDEYLRSVLPEEQGLYIIYDCSSDILIPIRAGRTKSASGV